MSVYTPVSATELETFLHEYPVGALTDYAGISAGVENSNFFVTTTQGAFVLTLFEHHTPAELGYFLDLMQHWADAGVPVARPIPNRAGQLLGTLKHKPAALVLRLAGQHIEHPTPEQCAALGTALAHLHLAGQTFPQQRAPDRGHDWRMHTASRLLPHLNPADAALLQTEMAFQQSIPFAQLPSGTIHADLFRDNVLFHDDHLSGVLDVYFACYDNWLYDLAIVVNDWCCHADDSLDNLRVQACLNAYQTVRPWQAIEHRYWYATLRAAALRFWLSRLDAQLNPRAGDNVLQKDPVEFRRKLLQRINASNVTVDARRLLCPLPVIRVQTAVDNLPAGVHLTAICTDPGALHDIPAWARIHGHTVLETHSEGREHVIVLQTGWTQ
ncbi:homoserine kinase [Thiothrix subterranea]|uniref:Homoserine kinase n=1 Tax=Thiothrix subterranea TaxID=2735563 RepID=A0AA51MM53_9GAMM|nr:homoserine kinase [Thiothrix subterranea]MDQ5770348.1 homoserine kinase [Thiothrix subterranea]WML86785.1 homoserine kinase [Thiothrix subterranea]